MKLVIVTFIAISLTAFSKNSQAHDTGGMVLDSLKRPNFTAGMATQYIKLVDKEKLITAISSVPELYIIIFRRGEYWIIEKDPAKVTKTLKDHISLTFNDLSGNLTLEKKRLPSDAHIIVLEN